MAILGSVVGNLGGGGGLGTLVLRLTADANNLVNELGRAQSMTVSASAAMTRTVVALGAAVTATFTAMGVLSVKEFAKWERSFSDVRKTVDGTVQELDTLGGALRQMSLELPFNVNEINKVAASAGQLGIKQKDIRDFTETMMQMGIATDLSADQAATALAQFANITQMPHEAFSNLASAIANVDKNSVATAKKVVDMGLRIAAAGTQVGLTRTEILGIAGAVSSIGIHAELGGTAVSQTLSRMSMAVHEGGEELEAFASIAKMTTGEFQAAFAKSAGTAFQAFVKGLKESSDAGENVFGMLRKIGTEGVRVMQTQIGLAGSGAILEDHLKLTAEGWEQNNVHVKMSQERYKTFSNQLILTGNHLRELAITIGSVLAPHLLKFNELFRDSLKDTGKLTDTIKNLAENTLPFLVSSFQFVGQAMSVGFSQFGKVFDTLFKDMDKMGGGLKKFADDVFPILLEGIKEIGDIIFMVLEPALVSMNKALTENGIEDWGDMAKKLVDFAIPALLTGIGMVGDAVNGWKMIFAMTEIAVSKVMSALLQQMDIATTLFAKAVAWLFNQIINLANTTILKLNLAIKAVNALISVSNKLQVVQVPTIPEMPTIKGMELKVDANAGDLKTWIQSFNQVANEAEARLEDMANKPSFSDVILGDFDKMKQQMREKLPGGEEWGDWASDFWEDTIDGATKAGEKVKEIMKDLPNVKVELEKIQENRAVTDAKEKLDKMEMPGVRVDKKGRKHFEGLGPGLGGFEDQGVRQGMELSFAQKKNEEDLKELRSWKDKELDLGKEYNEKMMAQLEAQAAREKQIRSATAQFAFQVSSKMFDDLANIAEAFGGKQSGVYKAMFAVSKAFAIADAIVKIQQGIAGAFVLPWPANLAAAASVIAATSSIVSTISSVNLAFGGGKEKGGPVDPSKVFLVGEKGPELFVPTERGTIIPNHMLGTVSPEVLLPAPVRNEIPSIANEIPSIANQILLPESPAFPEIRLPGIPTNSPTTRANALPALPGPRTVERGIMSAKDVYKAPRANATGIGFTSNRNQETVLQSVIYNALQDYQYGGSVIYNAEDNRHYGGKREKGGPVKPNQVFLVGEKGPELFVPEDTSIVSNYVENTENDFLRRNEQTVLGDSVANTNMVENQFVERNKPLVLFDRETERLVGYSIEPKEKKTKTAPNLFTNNVLPALPAINLPKPGEQRQLEKAFSPVLNYVADFGERSLPESEPRLLTPSTLGAEPFRNVRFRSPMLPVPANTFNSVETLIRQIETTASESNLPSNTLNQISNELRESEANYKEWKAWNELEHNVISSVSNFSERNFGDVTSQDQTTYGGERAAGGTVEEGKSFLVGERGPEMFVPSKQGRIVPNNELGATRKEPIKVVVNNYTDAKPEVMEKEENGQKTIEITVRRVKNDIAAEIREGRGEVTRAMESSFRLRRGI